MGRWMISLLFLYQIVTYTVIKQNDIQIRHEIEWREKKKKPIKIDGGQVQLGGNTRKQRLVVIRMQIFFFV